MVELKLYLIVQLYKYNVSSTEFSVTKTNPKRKKTSISNIYLFHSKVTYFFNLKLKKYKLQLTLKTPMPLPILTTHPFRVSTSLYATKIKWSY